MPTAALGTNPAGEEFRSSLDIDLLKDQSDPGQSSAGSESTIAEDQGKDMELHDIENSQNGVTRQISVPSPTSSNGVWGSSGGLSNPAEVFQAWRLSDQGPRTRRAELEFQKIKKSGESR